MSNLYTKEYLKRDFNGLNGLECSIEKWELIVKHWDEVTFGYMCVPTCGLCEQYPNRCYDCPLHVAGYGCDEKKSLFERIGEYIDKPYGKRLAKELLKILKGLK